MAKRITTGKKDREKLKQQKRVEKQKRKEERQSSGTRSFEEMLAYTDENGILHSTPQEKSKDSIDISEVVISTPKQEEITNNIHNGRVEHFNVSKGYGFIKDSDNNEQYFFHISSAPTNIAEGDKVTFEIEHGTRGVNAVHISIINK